MTGRVWARFLPFPSEREPAKREPVKGTRRDGSECDLLASVGAKQPDDVSPDEFVSDWWPVT